MKNNLKFENPHFYASISFKYIGNKFLKKELTADIYFPAVNSVNDFKVAFPLFKKEIFSEAFFGQFGKETHLKIEIRNSSDFTPSLLNFVYENGKDYQDKTGHFNINEIQEDFLENLEIDIVKVYAEYKRIL